MEEGEGGEGEECVGDCGGYKEAEGYCGLEEGIGSGDCEVGEVVVVCKDLVGVASVGCCQFLVCCHSAQECQEGVGAVDCHDGYVGYVSGFVDEGCGCEYEGECECYRADVAGECSGVVPEVEGGEYGNGYGCGVEEWRGDEVYFSVEVDQRDCYGEGVGGCYAVDAVHEVKGVYCCEA